MIDKDCYKLYLCILFQFCLLLSKQFSSIFVLLKIQLLTEIHELLTTLRGVMANQLASGNPSILEESYQDVFPVISVEVGLFHGLGFYL